MSVKILIRVAGALVIVLVLWGLAELVTGRGDVVDETTAVTAVTAEGADTVVFMRDADTITLAKREGQWEVNGRAASRRAIDELFHAIGDGVEGQLVARSASSHARMGVDAAGGRFRVVAGGLTLADLVVGERGAGFRGRYVRSPDDERVYLIDGRLPDLYNRTVDEWRNKDIVTIEPAAIGRIAVERGGETYTIVRHETGWTFADGSPTDSAAVEEMVREWGTVTAQGGTPFASPTQVDSADFRRPDRRATLLGLDGDTLARLVFDSTDAGFWVRRDSGGTVYNLFRWKVNDLMPTDSSVRRKESE